MKRLALLLVVMALTTGSVWAQAGSLAGMNIAVQSKGVYTPESQFPTPKPGKKLYAVEVTMTNSSKATASYNVMNFSLQDSQGYVYTFTPGKQPYLSCGDLEAGRMVRGFITFDVPAGAGGFTLIYKPSLVSGGQLLLKL